jgi:Domain of unknown function (DUF4384)
MKVVFAVFAACLASAQDDVRTRNLWDSTFLEHRPPSGPSKPIAGGSKPMKPRPTDYVPASDAFVGFTMWRLRPSRGEDEHVRLFVHGAPTQRPWTPERIEIGKPIQEGQMVRFSIESARPGYLYLIDSEQFADGSVGEPHLLFPTRRLRGGNNKVQPGMLVDIPGWEDDPPYVNVRRSGGNHTGEVLTIVVTPQPLPTPELSNEPIVLARDQVDMWERQWRVPAKALDSPGQSGRPMTLQEQQSAIQKYILTKADPIPQMLYRLDAKPDQPLLVRLEIRIE